MNLCILYGSGVKSTPELYISFLQDHHQYVIVLKNKSFHLNVSEIFLIHKYSLFYIVCVMFASEVELFALSLLHFIVFISDCFSDL